MVQERRLFKFTTHISACSPEASYTYLLLIIYFKALIYGNCVAKRAEKVQLNDCQKEFEKFIACFKKHVSFFKYSNFIFFLCFKYYRSF